MAFDKDVLGTALYNAEKTYNDKDPQTLGTLEDARLAFWKVLAQQILNHIHTNGQVVTTGSPTNHTGTIS